MDIQSSFICLKELRFHAFHGVLPQERATGNDYTVSLRVGFDISKAAETDDVEHTVNYAVLHEIVRNEMGQPSKLIEHVAGRIGKKIAERFPGAESVDITITKENPPIGADCKGASVELHLINDKTI